MKLAFIPDIQSVEDSSVGIASRLETRIADLVRDAL
jgi:hypothetical protein